MIAHADLHSLQYVARNMSALDRAEVFATRSNNSADDLAVDATGSHHSYVCSVANVPVSAFGALEIWPGVWSVWMFSTDALTIGAGSAILRHFRRVVAPSALAAGCHRVQCDSLKIHHQAHQFIERFGGRREAIMRGYGSGGEDFVRFSWDRHSLDAQCPKLHVFRDNGIRNT